MDGITVSFIVIFGIGAAVPAVWSIIGLARGNTRYWPGVLGAVWAVGLLLPTFIGIGTEWGGCPPSSETSEGAIQCYRNPTDEEPLCKPDLWKLECNVTPRETCGVDKIAIPEGAYCPVGFSTVTPFCEPIQSGGTRQPWAVWSDLSFIAAGLWLLWGLSFTKLSESTRMAGPRAENPMRMIGWLSVVYGMIVIFMGPPSQWYHASLEDWGGWFDTMSVVLWLQFNAVYVIYMASGPMWDRGRKTERTILVMSIWALVIVASALIALEPDARTALYFAGGIPWGVAELVYLGLAFGKKDKVKYVRNHWLFVANFTLLAGTMILWGFFNDSMVGTDCIGRKDVAGHALFHILASFSCVLTYFSFWSEKSAS